MKKLILILIALAVVTAGIFVAVAINVNRYRPLVEQKLAQVLGTPVRLGMLHVGGVRFHNDAPDLR